MTSHLFLYGTLLPSLAPPEVRPLVAPLELVAEATLPGRLHDLGRYPAAIVDREASTTIKGEIFRLPDPANEALAMLDAYEEYDPTAPDESLYVRQVCEATLRDGTRLPCWVYVYNRDPGNALLIMDGDYIRHRGKRS